MSITCPNPDCGRALEGKIVVRTERLAKEIMRERKCPHCGWTWMTAQPVGEEKTVEGSGKFATVAD